MNKELQPITLEMINTLPKDEREDAKLKYAEWRKGVRKQDREQSAREYSRLYHFLNREQLRKYYEENKEKLKERQKRYYKESKEKTKQKRRSEFVEKRVKSIVEDWDNLTFIEFAKKYGIDNAREAIGAMKICKQLLNNKDDTTIVVKV